MKLKHTPPIPRDIITALALAVAATGILICLYQQHFTVSLHHPSSFAIATQHRCGRVLIASQLLLLGNLLYRCLRHIRANYVPPPALS
jgi:hypothetical protein